MFLMSQHNTTQHNTAPDLAVLVGMGARLTACGAQSGKAIFTFPSSSTADSNVRHAILGREGGKKGGGWSVSSVSVCVCVYALSYPPSFSFFRLTFFSPCPSLSRDLSLSLDLSTPPPSSFPLVVSSACDQGQPIRQHWQQQQQQQQ